MRRPFFRDLTLNAVLEALLVAAMALLTTGQARADFVNLALGGRAAQTSTSITFGGEASWAIDGNTDGEFGHGSVTHTEPGDARPTWVLELREESAISRIVVWNRTDCCQGRLSNFKVEVIGRQGQTENVVFDQDFFSDGRGFPNPNLVIDLPGRTVGHKVRLTLMTNFSDAQVLSLAEVEVLGVATSKSGDMNGDDSVDISDAVYLLRSLFLGGPDPVPMVLPRPALPDTGQSKCYDGFLGNEIPCSTVTCDGQDGQYRTGCPREDRFVDNGDGTVTDHCTGLMWQKDLPDLNRDGVADDLDYVRLCEALAYCEGLSLAGHDDWRLPNIRELQSIVDYGRPGAAIDPVFGVLPFRYLSSTSFAGDPVKAWVVNFSNGDTEFLEKANSNFIRAVRSGR